MILSILVEWLSITRDPLPKDWNFLTREWLIYFARITVMSVLSGKGEELFSIKQAFLNFFLNFFIMLGLPPRNKIFLSESSDMSISVPQVSSAVLSSSLRLSVWHGFSEICFCRP